MYQRRVKIFKGMDNVVEFDFKNAQQRTIDISELHIQCVIMDLNDLEVHVAEVIPVVGKTGLTTMTLPAEVFANIDPQYLKYSLYILDEMDNKTPIYADTQFGVSGNMELVSGAMPLLPRPAVIDTFMKNTSRLAPDYQRKYISEAVEIKPKNDLNDTTTISLDLSFNGLDGEVQVQFTDALTISNEVKWTNIDSFTVVPATSFLGKTYSEGTDYTNSVGWMRVIYTPTINNTGSITVINVRFNDDPYGMIYSPPSKYNWKRDRLDARDFMYEAPRNTIAPSKVDLRPRLSAIEDQQTIGSCVGNAIAGIIEYQNNRAGKRYDVSRLFIYYQSRLLGGNVKRDSGAYIRDGIKACYTYGAPLEALWPYTTSRWSTRPTTAAYRDALRRRVTMYQRCVDFNAVKAALAEGLPVVVGFTVYSSFDSTIVERTGVMPYPDTATEQVLGGHAVAIVGYDDARQWFIVRNSWGTSWGDNGYFYMPYRVIQNTSMSSDFWVISSVQAP